MPLKDDTSATVALGRSGAGTIWNLRRSKGAEEHKALVSAAQLAGIVRRIEWKDPDATGSSYRAILSVEDMNQSTNV